jgi:hypothetical protein
MKFLFFVGDSKALINILVREVFRICTYSTCNWINLFLETRRQTALTAVTAEETRMSSYGNAVRPI